MPRDKKLAKSRNTAQSANKEWYRIEPLTPGPFPFQEKA
jgi:hypothetical protein